MVRARSVCLTMQLPMQQYGTGGAPVNLLVTASNIYWDATGSASSSPYTFTCLPQEAIKRSQFFQDLLAACGGDTHTSTASLCPSGHPPSQRCPSLLCCTDEPSPNSSESVSSLVCCGTAACMESPFTSLRAASPAFTAAPIEGPGATTVQLVVPADAFAAWLDFALSTEPPPAASDAVSAAHAPVRKATVLTTPELLALLQVADVLIDVATITRAAPMLGAALFLAPAPPPAAAVDEFSWLPVDVAMAALRSCGVAFADLCRRLPPSLHSLALHAAIPSITACASADLSHTAPLATALSPWTLPTLSHVSCLVLVNHADLRTSSADRAGALDALAHVLAHLRHLSTLDVSQNSLGDDGMARLAPSLRQQAGKLKILRLAGNLIQSPAAAGLGCALAAATGLEELDMHSNLIDCSGFQELAPHIIALRTPKSVNISCNKLESFGATALGALVATWACVEDLDVSGNGIGSAGASALLDGLARKSLKSVTALDLSFNNLQKRDWVDAGVSTAISRFRGLQKLDVGFNEIHTGGCAALSTALRRLPMLRQLGLYRAGIGEGAARLLVSGLARLSWLEVLDLRHNRIKVAAMALVAALPVPERLVRLRLCGNRIGDDTTAELLQMLPQRTAQLELLGLARNRVGPRACAALAAALPALPRMQEVRLDDNALPRADAERLSGFACVVMPGGSGRGAVGAAADLAAAADGGRGQAPAWEQVHVNNLWENAVWDELQTFSSGECRTAHAMAR
eukprot:jgi/Ulvmu1/1938/UM012_0098.1